MAEEKDGRKRILLVKNESPYDMQGFLLKQVGRILESEYNICYYEYDKEIGQEYDGGRYVGFLRGEEFDLIITVDMTGFGQRLLDDDSYYNTLYCPMIHLLTKEAWQFSHYLNDRYNFTMYFYHPFQDSVDYINGIMKHFPNIEKLSPLGFRAAEPKPYEERSLGVYFPSTYEPPEKILKEIKGLPAVFASMALAVEKAMESDGSLSLYEALRRYLAETGFAYEPSEFIDMIYEIRRVNTYIKMRHADACVRALLEENVPVTVSGKGWENFLGPQGRVPQIIGENGLNYEKMLSAMADAKIVLNNQIHKKGGVHTRISNAMLQGALSLSDRDGEITKYFKDGEEIVLYDSFNPREMAARAARLLEDGERAKAIARRGYEAARLKCDLKEPVFHLVGQQVEDSQW